MKIWISLFLLLAPLAASAELVSEKRCGWLAGTTTTAHSFMDPDGSWNVSRIVVMDEEDGRVAEEHFVRLRGEYGYSCACLQVMVDHQADEIAEVEAVFGLPLKNCLEDRRLARMVPHI
ncbi:DUF4087 domain-containing protein [Geopseudomonas aromaticivorans]